MKIEWREPPAKALLQGTKPGRYVEFALALKEHPGKWAVLPGESRTDKGAKASAQNIRRGVVKGFGPKNHYEALADDTTVYVRYMPPEDAEGDDDTPAAQPEKPEDYVDPRKVREWANTNGFNLGRAGRIPKEVIEAYKHRPGATVHPMRAVREQ